MWLPCMHHTLELILSAVIATKWKTSGPTDPIYSKFQGAWLNILENMEDVKSKAKQIRNSILPKNRFMKGLQSSVKQLLQKMEGKHTYRGDFKEFKHLVEVSETFIICG